MRTIELILEQDQNYFLREAFNTLRTNVLFSGKEVKTIVVTSCIAHEGKTTVSFELSRNLAESGKKVLLIDADLRKSVMVTRYTKDRGIMGLSQLLSGQVEPEQAINKTQIEGFDLLFAGPYPPNPTELVGSAAFQELMRAARQIYDYVIIDAPPLGLVIDAAVMASYCDGAVIVVNAGNIKYQVAQNVKAQLQKSGCRILGVVLNQVQSKNALGNNGYYGSKYNKEYMAYHENAKNQHNNALGQSASGKVSPGAQAQQVRRPSAPAQKPQRKE